MFEPGDTGDGRVATGRNRPTDEECRLPDTVAREPADRDTGSIAHCFRTCERIYPIWENRCGSVNRMVVIRLVTMANGKVDFFNDTGGYGFISTDDSDDDVFFHMEDVGGEDLTEGTEIEFDIEQAPKGPRATNVVRN